MTQPMALIPPARERPKLLSDEPQVVRVVIVVALLAGTFVLGQGRYAIEGLYTGASVQVVFYNFARHWPPKQAGWFARWVCRPLLIPDQRLPSTSASTGSARRWCHRLVRSTCREPRQR